MGIFGNNYNTAGPGVSKNDPEKRRFFVFFELYGRKFTSLVKVNLIYFLLTLPAFCGFILTGSELKTLGIILLIGGLFLFGPATAAMTFAVRNYVMGRHVWLISDFKQQFKSNYKQGFILGVLDVFLPVILVYSFKYYIQIGGITAVLAGGMVVFASVIFAMVNFYAYPMMVTFDLTFMQIIKNSLFFSIAKFGLNLFILIVDSLIVYAMFNINAYIAVFLFAPFLLYSSICFITVFAVWKHIEDAMIPKNEEEESVFSDSTDI